MFFEKHNVTFQFSKKTIYSMLKKQKNNHEEYSQKQSKQQSNFEVFETKK